jgi:hypothetical protein
MGKCFLAGLVLILASVATTGCCKSEGSGAGTDNASSGSDKSADDGFVDVPNSHGLKAKVPDNAIPNGIGGAAGFHSKDDSFDLMVRKLTGPKTMEEAKKEAKQLFFKEWIGDEKTSDGWILRYKSSKLDMSSDEPKEVGTLYRFEVVKKIGGTDYLCDGAVKDEASMKACIDACKSVKM